MTTTIDLERLFFEVSEDFLREHQCFSTRGELGVYSNAAVVWLGIQQRLHGNSLASSMSALVKRIKEESSAISLALRPGKKIRAGEISINTGGISRARQRLPESLVSSLFEAATDNIEKQLGEAGNVYVLDGQVITLSRSDSTLAEFGHIHNGEGEFHFPKIRVVSVHHMKTGIAKGLTIGTYFDSECTLATSLISRLPEGSIVVMDRFYDKPTFIDVVTKKKIKVVVRLSEKTAKKLFEKLPKTPTAEKQVNWIPTTKSLKHISIPGRVFKHTAQQSGFRSSHFFFFSTAEEFSLAQVADLYRQRVRVEIFIRQLKQTLKMFFVRAKKAHNIKKEIYIAYLTFNLLRAVMHKVAIEGNLEPERMSFTAAINLTKAYAGAFLRAKTSAQTKQLIKEFCANMKQAQLPKRKKDRSYPRVIKYPRDKYPKRGIVKEYASDMEGK